MRDRTGATVLVATHDTELAARADRRLLLRGGRLHDDAPVPVAAAIEPVLAGV